MVLLVAIGQVRWGVGLLLKLFKAAGRSLRNGVYQTDAHTSLTMQDEVVRIHMEVAEDTGIQI